MRDIAVLPERTECRRRSPSSGSRIAVAVAAVELVAVVAAALVVATDSAATSIESIFLDGVFVQINKNMQ